MDPRKINPRDPRGRSDPIRIVSYDSRWSVLFSELGSTLRGALGDTALRIDHIGSTAVPGLASKPVVDVQVSVASLGAHDPWIPKVEAAGYVFRGDNPDLTKRYFREIPGTRRTHIHVRKRGSWSEQFALLFRDFLREHADWCGRYAALKHDLARLYAHDREAYTEAKGPFIWEVMREASDWSQHTGWEPSPSDA